MSFVIYVIRHGQTELNVQGIINGHIPDNLTEVGREQARQAAHKLPRTIQHIYTSPLTRAKQTAEILNETLKVALTHHDELKEVNFGKHEGTPFSDDHKAKHISLTYDWGPSGENFEQVKQRVLDLLTQIHKEAKNGEALLVTHGGIVRMITYLETGEKQGEISNAGLFKFDLDRIIKRNGSIVG